MRTFVVEPPEPVVTWSDADTHLKLDGDETQKLYVEGLIAAATKHIDGPTGWLGRAVGVQTLEARLDNFGCGVIRLPYPPIIQILSVQYVEPTGSVVTVDAAGWELAGRALCPAFGVAWPTPRWQREAVRVRYRAGHDPEDAIGKAELAPIKTAILLMVGDLFEGRTTAEAPLSSTAEALLGPLRVWM